MKREDLARDILLKSLRYSKKIAQQSIESIYESIDNKYIEFGDENIEDMEAVTSLKLEIKILTSLIIKYRHSL